MNKDALKHFVESNPKLVSMKPAGDGIFVLKYSKKVFYDNLWNDFLEECRGTIIDKDFNVISRPFTKIYNYGVEEKAPVLADDVKVTAYRKVNGFMVAMTWYKDAILVSTTGSTDNDYVNYAKEIMQKQMPWADWEVVIKANSNATFMFECVHPSDPHIIPEKEGMYFLGARTKAWDSTVYGYGTDNALTWRIVNGAMFMGHPMDHYHVTIGELKKMSKECKHEGFVFYTEDNVSAKIKSPYYLTHKWVARNPRTDKIMTDAFMQQIDEEYYPLLAAIRENIVEYTAMDEQSRLSWVRNFLED